MSAATVPPVSQEETARYILRKYGDAFLATSVPRPRPESQDIPQSIGEVRHVEPVPFDPEHGVYAWHRGLVRTVHAVWDSGVPLLYDGDCSDVLAHDVPAGRFISDNSRGLIRLGAPPVGLLTLDGCGGKPISQGDTPP